MNISSKLYRNFIIEGCMVYRNFTVHVLHAQQHLNTRHSEIIMMHYEILNKYIMQVEKYTYK